MTWGAEHSNGLRQIGGRSEEKKKGKVFSRRGRRFRLAPTPIFPQRSLERGSNLPAKLNEFRRAKRTARILAGRRIDRTISLVFDAIGNFGLTRCDDVFGDMVVRITHRFNFGALVIVLRRNLTSFAVAAGLFHVGLSRSTGQNNNFIMRMESPAGFHQWGFFWWKNKWK